MKFPLRKPVTLVLALNPCIDAEWRVADVQWEEKNLVESERRWAGGKGVNVARWLRCLGGRPQLLLPLGGATGREFAAHLRREGLPCQVLPLRDPTRVNVLITTAAGRQLRFNQSGPLLGDAEWRAILRRTRAVLRRGALLILSGSLPRGLPADACAQLTRLAHRVGARTLVDCDGAAFAAAVVARPFLVKPNEHELAQWAGRPLRSRKAIRAAALKLSQTTRGWVLVSRGPRGALLVNAQEDFCAEAPAARVRAVNTLGAGDAMLAAVAWAIERALEPEEWLQQGVLAGSAATQCRAGELPERGR
ncbi:MAG: 1-phosphofructokinase family hexose kinase [Verrucomicrobia bacterium]|nr:1-phosphofructokinase family hexose kinase [Verrucomicrobiota bacterium]